MGKLNETFIYLFLLTLKVSYCSIPKKYFETLLSNNFFNGLDLIVSVEPESEENLLSWLQQDKNLLFSVVLVETNLSQSLEYVREKSTSSEQISIIIEFRNVTHLEQELQMAKQYSTNTTVPQPSFFILTQSPEQYDELGNDIAGLSKLSHEFSINSDFYIFGELLEESQSQSNSSKAKSKRPKKTLNDDDKQGFIGYPLPKGYELSELYSFKNTTFFEPVDLRRFRLLQKVIRRNDFKRTPLIAVAQLETPGGANFSADRSSFTSGYEVDQLDFLASSYNFTVVPKVGSGWISLSPENKVTGMGAQLRTREADIAISSSEMLLYRAEQLTFLHPTYYTTIWGFFKQPTTNSLRDIFINAFTTDLWLTMFATWFLIIMAMFALTIVKWRLGTLHDNDKVVIQEVFIWAVGAICQQGWHVCPESGCLKIVFIFALITGLVSYVGYSAALVSILSVKVVPIQSLSDLVNYKYMIYQDNETMRTTDIMRDLGARTKLLPLGERSIDSESVMKKLLSSQSAFLGVADVFYPAARKTLCSDFEICKNIQRISVSKGRPVQGGMIVRKRSSLTDFLNHRILLMYERGIRYRLLEGFYRATSVTCLDLNASEKEPLGFNDVVTAYVILLIGYLLSLTIFVLEKLYSVTIKNPSVEQATSTPTVTISDLHNYTTNYFHTMTTTVG